MSRPVPNRARRALARIAGRGSGAHVPQSPQDDPFLRTTTATDRAIIERCLPHTMSGVPRLQSVIDAVRYCHGRPVPGALAECGVWRGGTVLAMVLTLQDLGVADRDVYLYDTFEGMTAPTAEDVSPFDPPASETWDAARSEGVRAWDGLFSEQMYGERHVRELLTSTGYPPERLHIVRGPVEETLPAHAPDGLALLRLDTDWYESTRCEMEHLYPRLATGGVLIVDDYGHWEGARRAVDEALAGQPPLLLNRVDYTARIAIKA